MEILKTSQIEQKITDYRNHCIKALSFYEQKNYSNCTQELRKSCEAMFKILLFSHFGDKDGLKLVLGKLDFNRRALNGKDLMFQQLFDNAKKTSKYNSRVIEKGAQIAKNNHATLSAVYVQTPKDESMSAASKSCLRENIKFAESKGAKVTILYGHNKIRQIVEYVDVSQVDCVVIEKSLASQALFRLRDIDVYSVNYPHDYRRLFYFDFSSFRFSFKDLLKMILILILCTLIGKGFMHFQFLITTPIMIYILGIVFVSIWTSGYIYSLLASLFSVLCFNFFFT